MAAATSEAKAAALRLKVPERGPTRRVASDGDHDGSFLQRRAGALRWIGLGPTFQSEPNRIRAEAERFGSRMGLIRSFRSLPWEVRVQCWRARRTCLGARQSSGRGESGEARRFREVREAQVNAPVECSQGDPGVEEGG